MFAVGIDHKTRHGAAPLTAISAVEDDDDDDG
jgi:hypothetical protein